MTIESLHLAYFSPTGTTKAIAQAIARGINHKDVKQMDATSPRLRKSKIITAKNDLLLVAVPVYIGRVPALLYQWLHSIKADNTPTVCIVVYGNRAYDDALLELKDSLTERGCIPIACAAYIGEHSFSSSQTPIAEGRPDSMDLNSAEEFGKTIRAKLVRASSVDHVYDMEVPGNRPYRGDPKLWTVDFIEISDKCIQCGLCAEACPVDAIDREKSNTINKEKCITCCACIKKCIQNARTLKSGLVKDAALRLSELYKERKDPVRYLFFERPKSPNAKSANLGGRFW